MTNLEAPTKTENRIHKLSVFVDRPIVILVVLLVFIIWVAFIITGNQEKQKQALEDIHTSATNSELILARLETVVTDIKEDGKQRDDKQNRLLTCLLVIHGSEQAISEEAEESCRAEANGVLQQLEIDRQAATRNGTPPAGNTPTPTDPGTTPPPGEEEEGPETSLAQDLINELHRRVEPIPFLRNIL